MTAGVEKPAECTHAADKLDTRSARPLAGMPTLALRQALARIAGSDPKAGHASLEFDSRPFIATNHAVGD